MSYAPAAVGTDPEKEIIGTILYHPEELLPVAEQIRPDDFQSQTLRTIFSTALQLRAEGVTPDLVTVASRTGMAAKVAAIGPPASRNTAFFVDQIREQSDRKKAVTVVSTALEDLNSGAETTAIVQRVQSELQFKITDKETQALPVYRLIPAPEADLSAQKYALDRIVPEGGLVIIFGEVGKGKTLVTMPIAISIATGIGFFGRAVDRPGYVAYIAGEGQRSIALRARAAAHSAATSVPHNLLIGSVPVSLSDLPEMMPLFRALKSFRDTSGPIRAIIFDTLSRNLGPGDENSTHDMGALIRTVDFFREEFECAVILVHHSGHQNKERSRGSSVLKAAADAEFRVAMDGRIITFECTKMKDDVPPENMYFQLEPVMVGYDEEGVELSSAAITSIDYSPPKHGGQPRGKNQILAMEILRSETDRHQQNVADSGRDPDTARVSLDAWKIVCMGEGMAGNRFREVSETLRSKGLVLFESGYVSEVKSDE